MARDLYLYNTLSREKEKFVPVNEGQARMYVCGITAYDYAHLGHARTYLHYDVLVRLLRYLGYDVLYVQNITDVGHLTEDDAREDRVIKRARREKVDPMELVEIYMREFFADMDALGIIRPDISPRATAHIPEMLEVIGEIMKNGFAYEVNGSVYFDVTKFGEYGRLSRKKVEELIPGARVAVEREKRHPADFALWVRADENHILKWRSPWGYGYPGWHIECSTMSMKYLGKVFDIHGGAIELAMSHHENELAQSWGATGKHSVRYWVHTGMVMLDGVKMSKSLGNVITVKDLLKRYTGDVIRFLTVSSHYRSLMDYSDESVEQAARNLEKVRSAVSALEEAAASAPDGDGEKGGDLVREAERRKEAFIAALCDDMNSPEALAGLYALVGEVNRLLPVERAVGKAAALRVRDILLELGSLLGFNLSRHGPAAAPSDAALGGMVDLLVELRNRARAAKDFRTADDIRERLKVLGIMLEDSGGTTRWRRTGTL